MAEKGIYSAKKEGEIISKMETKLRTKLVLL